MSTTATPSQQASQARQTGSCDQASELRPLKGPRAGCLPSAPAHPERGGHGQAPPLRYLVLWPTAACDLDCVYCYRRDRSGGRMPRRLVTQAVQRVLDDAATSGMSFHIQLAGGEPTLVPEVIAQVVAMVTDAGYPASWVGIQTNATQIDAVMALQFAQWGIQVGVSLDGPPAIQDQTRGKARETFRGLMHLAAFGVPVRITTVVSAMNAERLDEVVLTLAAFEHIRGFGLDPIVGLGSAAGRADLVPTTEALERGITKLYTAFHLVNAGRQTPLQWRELDVVRTAMTIPTEDPGLTHQTDDLGSPPTVQLPTTLPVHQPRPYCFAVTGQSMAVSPAGAVYPCSQTVGDPTRCAGTLNAIHYPALAQLQTIPRLDGPCERCQLRRRCPGDCPSRLAAPVVSGTHPLMCVIYRTIADLECPS